MRDPWALKAPAYTSVPEFEHTDGPAVAALCEQVGLAPDPEQRMMLDVLFGLAPSDEQRDENGDPVWLSAAFESCVVAPRQNMKTGLMKMAALGWLFVTKEKVVTWSAHEFTTTSEAFDDLRLILENTPMLRRRLAPGPSGGIYGGNVSPRIVLADGRKLKFKARTKTGARGLTGDKIVLDEAFALQPSHTGSIHPTLTAVPDPQILYGSSAGMVGSSILRDLRDRGRRGSPGLAYWEWCSERRPCVNDQCTHAKPGTPQWLEGCALDAPDLWAEGNTLLGRQRSNGTGLTLEKMRKFRLAEDPHEFMRERMGWWDEGGADELFGPGHWAECSGEVPGSTEVESIGIAVAFGQTSAAVVGAGHVGDRPVILPMKSGPGTTWILDYVAEVAKGKRIPVVVDGGGPAGFLVEGLRKITRRTRVLTLNQCKDACAEANEAVRSHSLLHANFPELNAAVGAASWRDVSDRQLLGRREGGDITVLEGGFWALYGLGHKTGSAYEDRARGAVVDSI